MWGYLADTVNLKSPGVLIHINPSDESGIFQDDQVNIIAANALAPCITRSSAAMVLAMQDKQVFVFHKVGFQIWVPT